MDEIDEPAPVANRPEQEFIAPGLGTTDGFRALDERQQGAREETEQARAEQKSHVRSMLQSLPTLGSANVADVHEDISGVIDRTYSDSTEITASSLLYFVIGLIVGPAIVAVWTGNNYSVWSTTLLYVLAFFLGMIISISASLAWFAATDVSHNTNYLWAWTHFNSGNETNTSPSRFAKQKIPS